MKAEQIHERFRVRRETLAAEYQRAQQVAQQSAAQNAQALEAMRRLEGALQLVAELEDQAWEEEEGSDEA